MHNYSAWEREWLIPVAIIVTVEVVLWWIAFVAVAGRAFAPNGISAMPSMHVGLTLWLALVLRHTRWAKLTWTYFVLIWLGSVHLGWHYASDGLVAGLAILLIWRCAPFLAWKVRSKHPIKQSFGVASFHCN